MLFNVIYLAFKSQENPIATKVYVTIKVHYFN